jgi:hypothetical protein
MGHNRAEYPKQLDFLRKNTKIQHESKTRTNKNKSNHL